MNTDFLKIKDSLLKEFESLKEKKQILNSKILKDLYLEIPRLDAAHKANFGKEVNNLKNWLTDLINKSTKTQQDLPLKNLDLSAPFDLNAPIPDLHGQENGSLHPITQEINILSEIFKSMGFEIWESRLIDNDYHMFTSLNFAEGHPARDEYDTFITEEGFIAPAHTSTMQNRILEARKDDLEEKGFIATIVPDRVFRNEDVDARHEHTFAQFEGIYVAKKVNIGNLVATLKEFLSTYYKTDIETRINPFYFPFVEPGFEFSLSCPFCHKKGCNICSQSGWIELLGCGMIHPNVLKMAGIDSTKYSGFAWGVGIERLIMIKYGIEDIRLFYNGKLSFLKQF
jgi:phenylalanyl-tRNA synthetase alpha chain